MPIVCYYFHVTACMHIALMKGPILYSCSTCNSTEFTAVLSNGSDVVYNWLIDSLPVLTTARNKVRCSLSHITFVGIPRKYL